MSSEKNPDTFDRLVSSISDDERKVLLDKLKPGTSEVETFSFEGASVSDITDSTDFGLRLHSEPLLYRIILWIKSLFTNTTIDVLYSKDIIASIGREIDSSFPGLIDRRHCYVLSEFYRKLYELKRAADFFKSYVNEVEQDPGAFYLTLGSFSMPSVNVSMEEAANPYVIPLTKDVTTETRASMLRKMDDVLKKIPTEERALMYKSTRGVEWLRQFVNLPFDKFLALFTDVVPDTYTCTFSDACGIITDFSNTLCNGQTISEPALSALYTFAGRKIAPEQESEYGNTESKLNDFIEKATAQLSMIRMFITTVPMRDITCVLYQNPRWQPTVFGGHEDWFVKYKAQWKKIFDQRWKSWQNDNKKEKIRGRLKENFGLDSFPLLPYRPWIDMWGGIIFQHELTGGFLFWFYTNKYLPCLKVLKIILVEGVFINKDNRKEFSDTLDELDQIYHELEAFIGRLSPDGSTGLVFNKLSDSRMHTKQGQAKVDSLMLAAETNVSSFELNFCAQCRKLELILGGILSIQKDTRYDTLQNLSTIQGPLNQRFRSDIASVKIELYNASTLLNDFEPVEKSGIKE